MEYVKKIPLFDVSHMDEVKIIGKDAFNETHSENGTISVP